MLQDADADNSIDENLLQGINNSHEHLDEDLFQDKDRSYEQNLLQDVDNSYERNLLQDTDENNSLDENLLQEINNSSGGAIEQNLQHQRG